jgi:hypothetical protein
MVRESVDAFSLESELNMMGHDGWKLVNMSEQQEGMYVRYKLVFEIEEVSE